jgi:hypothetical protein
MPTFKIQSVTDATILAKLQELATESDFSFTDVQLIFPQEENNRTTVSTSFNITSTDLGNLDFDTSTRSVAQFQTLIPLSPGRAKVTVTRTVAFDELGIVFQQTGTNQSPPFQLGIKLVTELQKHFPPVNTSEEIEKILGEDLSSFYHNREDALMRLEEFSQKIGQDNAEFRQKTEKELESKREKLQQEFDEKNERLNQDLQTERSRLNQEIEMKTETHKKAVEAFEEAKKKIDDRNNKHARREIYKRITEVTKSLATKFRLSKDTNRKRLIIHAVFLFTFAALILYSIFTIKSLGSTSTEVTGVSTFYVPIKLTLSSIAILGLGLYYIRWNDNWFKRHADEEFNIKRFELDMHRASWVVEMALEWKNETQSNLPPELLNKLTSHLFEPANIYQSPKHPSEDILSAILNASSELELNHPMGSAKFNNRGANKLKKNLEK